MIIAFPAFAAYAILFVVGIFAYRELVKDAEAIIGEGQSLMPTRPLALLILYPWAGLMFLISKREYTQMKIGMLENVLEHADCDPPLSDGKILDLRELLKNLEENL